MISIQKQAVKVKIHIEHDVKQKNLGTLLSNNKINTNIKRKNEHRAKINFGLEREKRVRVFKNKFGASQFLSTN